MRNKIIIIEDGDELREAMAGYLSYNLKLKYNPCNPDDPEAGIVGFSNHTDAENWLHGHASECALIISDNDIVRQDFKGSEWIAEKLSRKGPISDIPMIYMSGNVTTVDQKMLVNAGLPKRHILQKMCKGFYDVMKDVYHASLEKKAKPESPAQSYSK